MRTIYYDAQGRITRARNYIPGTEILDGVEVGYLHADIDGSAAGYYVDLAERKLSAKQDLTSEFDEMQLEAGEGIGTLPLPAGEVFHVRVWLNGAVNEYEVADGSLELSSAVPGAAKVEVASAKYHRRTYKVEFV